MPKKDGLPDSLPIDQPQEEHSAPRRVNIPQLAAVVVGIILIAGLGLVGFEQIYAAKIVPGVTGAGIYLGGMSKADAAKVIQAKVNNFQTQQLALRYGQSSILVPISSLDFKYDVNRTVDTAFAYGRQGSWFDQTYSRLRALFSRPTNVAAYNFDIKQLTPLLLTAADNIDQPVSDASLNLSGGSVSVKPSVVGTRLDLGLATQKIKNSLAMASADPVDLPVYQMNPVIDQSTLANAKDQAAEFLKGPLTLKVNSATYTVDANQIVGWIRVADGTVHELGVLTLDDFRADTGSAEVTIDPSAVAAYVSTVAGQVNQAGQNAQLSIQGGRAVVFQPSRDGIALDQAGSVKAITNSLENSGSRQITLKVAVAKPEVTEQSLNNLGINELIAEGITYFPGSPTARMTNIRVGAAKFNGVLLKPGEQFSFGAILGDVGPAEGYTPALVIVGNHEEFQYGGGLCQVASTAYRAALLSGFPIDERHNHSYAVGYYTAPFGVPGVDATIFYPQADLKFQNNTGHYILIQTILDGTTLKFDYYGTKVASGQIRGPYFVSPANGSGWNEAVPSHTVFYRDVLDLNGQVTKTDTINSYYASSNDFPITNQFN